MRQIVLASRSAYRKALLARLWIPFECASPGVDEAEWKSRALPPDELARALSVAKAEAVAMRYPDALVIGSDQIVESEGEILDKPGTFESAGRQLAQLAGCAHRLLTALTVLDSRTGDARTELDVHVMRMRPLEPGEIRRYLEIDRPLDCAGSYKIESAGIALFESVEGEDWSAITGLPLLRLVRILAECGVPVFARDCY